MVAVLVARKLIQYFFSLHSHEYFTVKKKKKKKKYNTRKIHTKLHPGPAWCTFHILTSEDIGDAIPAFSRLFMQTFSEKWQAVDLSI